MLNYKTLGEGPAILLVHGLLGSLDNLNVIARNLQQNYQVINIDLPNHGESAHTEQVNYQLIADEIELIRQQLGLDTWHMLGHSMGGKAVMQYALNYPDKVNKLIVADISPVAYGNRHQIIFNALQSLPLSEISSRQQADQLLSDAIAEAGIRQFLLRSLTKTEQGFTWKFNLELLQQEYSNIIAAIDSPLPFNGKTLFIKGQNSDYILPEHRETIASLFPNSKAKIIQGAGHWLHAEKPTIFNRIVEQFLAE